MLRSPHLHLLVADFPADFRFYRDVLGSAPRFGSEDDVYTEFSVGDQTLALFRRDLMAEAVGASSKAAKAVAALRAKGVALTAGPQNQPNWGVRAAHLRDPDGDLIEINSPLPV